MSLSLRSSLIKKVMLVNWNRILDIFVAIVNLILNFVMNIELSSFWTSQIMCWCWSPQCFKIFVFLVYYVPLGFCIFHFSDCCRVMFVWIYLSQLFQWRHWQCFMANGVFTHSPKIVFIHLRELIVKFSLDFWA